MLHYQFFARNAEVNADGCTDLRTPAATAFDHDAATHDSIEEAIETAGFLLDGCLRFRLRIHVANVIRGASVI